MRDKHPHLSQIEHAIEHVEEVIEHAIEEVAEPAKRVARGGLAIIVAGAVAFVTLALALVVVAASGILPLSGFEGRIIAAIEERLGPNWQAGMKSATLERVDGRSAVRVADVLIAHNGGMTLRAPQAVLSYDLMALLTGTVRFTGIDIRGVHMKLGVDVEGAIVLDAGSAPVKLAPGVTRQGGESPETALVLALLAAVDVMAREGGELSALETAGLSESRLSLVDADGRERIGFDNVNVHMRSLESARRRIDVSAHGASGAKDFSIDLLAGEGGLRNASIELRRVEAADLFALVFGDRWGAIEGLALSGRVAMEARDGAAMTARVDLSIAPGQIHLPGVSAEPFRLDGGGLKLAFDPMASSAEIESLRVRSGATDLALAGTAGRGADELIGVKLAGKGVLAGHGGDPAVQVDRFVLDLEGRPGGDANLKLIGVVGPKANVAGSAVFRTTPDGPAITAQLKATSTDLRAALAIWPPFTSPNTHALMAARAQAGLLDDLDLTLDFDSETLKAQRAGLPPPDGAIRVVTRARGVRFRIADGLPPVAEATTRAVATGRTLSVETASASAQIGKGRALQLSEASLSIPDTWAARPQGRAEFRATGSAEALAALLAMPTLRSHAPGQIDPEALKGAVDLKCMVSLPLVDEVKAQDVHVTANGQFTNLASDTLLGAEKLESANLKVSYEQGALTLRGEGRVGGTPGQIEVRQDARGAGEASLSTTLDQAARQRRGLGFDGQLNGPVQVKVSKALGRAASANLRFEIDLTRAAIGKIVPGVSKPAGKASRMSFVLVPSPEGPDLDEFQFESAPVLARGKISLDRQNVIDGASFSQLRLSPGDDLRAEIAIENGVTRATIRGKVLDARPFLTQGSREGKPGPDVDIDLAVPIVTGHNGEALGNAVFKLSRRAGDLRQLSFEGKLGRAVTKARLVRPEQGTQQIAIESEDGGALLRFHDIYRRAHGGSFALLLTPGDEQDQGQLTYRNFVVRNEPSLRRVLAETTNATGNERLGNERAAPPKPAPANEVPFTRLTADFLRSPNRIDIKESVIWGPLVGFLAQGSIDYGRDRIDVAGTFVPAYAFNNAFSQVPILGLILGGGQHEGLFAVNFRLGGTPGQPTMTVNPLSALAPGILRKFVDPLGGTSGRAAPREGAQSQR